MSRFRRGMVALVMGVALTGSVHPAAAASRSMVNDGLSDDPASAIQQVILRNNQEQVQAVATRDLSVMADTVTDERFANLASTIQDMLNTRVTAIEMLNLDWGPITIAADGSTAKAVTYETWRIVSEVGTVDDEPMRNDYALLFIDGAWKIQADLLGAVPVPITGAAPLLAQ